MKTEKKRWVAEGIGYTIGRTDLGGWYGLLPGEKSFWHQADKHNYVGFCNTEEEILDELLEPWLKAASDWTVPLQHGDPAKPLKRIRNRRDHEESVQEISVLADDWVEIIVMDEEYAKNMFAGHPFIREMNLVEFIERAPIRGIRGAGKLPNRRYS